MFVTKNRQEMLSPGNDSWYNSQISKTKSMLALFLNSFPFEKGTCIRHIYLAPLQPFIQ